MKNTLFIFFLWLSIKGIYADEATSIASWCSNNRAFLENVLEDSQLILQESSQYKSATQTLLDGLKNALERVQQFHVNHVYLRSIQRGLKLGQFLSENKEGIPNEKVETTQYLVLTSYYHFLINKIFRTYSETSDLNEQLFSQYNNEVIDYVIESLKWFLEEYYYKDPHYQYGYLTRGTENSFLQTSLFLLESHQLDINQLSNRYQYACLLERMKYTENKIRDYINQKKSSRQIKILTNLVYLKLKSILSEIEETKSCK